VAHRGLDKYILDLLSFTPLQDSFFIFQQAQGLSGYTSPDGERSASLLTHPPYRLRSLSGYTLLKLKNFQILSFPYIILANLTWSSLRSAGQLN
jgi:hypothetical protein